MHDQAADTERLTSISHRCPLVAPSGPVSPARTVPLLLEIDRRHQTRTGGYWQSPFRYRGGLSALVELALLPLAAWTPATVADLLAAACVAMRGPSGRILTCGIYRDDAPGLDVRAGYSEEDLLRSQRAVEIGSARELAKAWRQAVLAKGRFAGLETVDE